MILTLEGQQEDAEYQFSGWYKLEHYKAHLYKRNGRGFLYRVCGGDSRIHAPVNDLMPNDDIYNRCVRCVNSENKANREYQQQHEIRKLYLIQEGRQQYLVGLTFKGSIRFEDGQFSMTNPHRIMPVCFHKINLKYGQVKRIRLTLT